MITKSVIEHLLYNNSDLRELFLNLGILYDQSDTSKDNFRFNPNLVAKKHTELENLLKPFLFIKENDLAIIMTISFIQSIFIINKNKINRRYRILHITGNVTRCIELGKSSLSSEISAYFNTKDFLPPALLRKIIYFDNTKNSLNLNGIMFVEQNRNIWSIENNDVIELSLNKKEVNISYSQIINQLCLNL